MELESTQTPNKIPLKVHPLEHFKGSLPEYKTEGSSGFDVRAQLKAPLTLTPQKRALIPTGLSFEIPQGFELQARPRSGLALKKGLTLLNTPGTIDSDYRGELKIILINLGDCDVEIKDQDRIAQMVLCPVYKAHLSRAEELEKSLRGGGGFGSTGDR